MTDLDQRARGVDHAAFPTFDPAGTVRFYRDVLGFPVVHSVCAAGWGPAEHPDFVHFFFDIGNHDRIAFFYYFGVEKFHRAPAGDSYAGFEADTPRYFIDSRHLPIDVASRDPELSVNRIGEYFEISSPDCIVIDRRATGCRHAVWYSAIAGIGGGRVVQHDKDALRIVPA